MTTTTISVIGHLPASLRQADWRYDLVNHTTGERVTGVGYDYVIGYFDAFDLPAETAREKMATARDIT